MIRAEDGSILSISIGAGVFVRVLFFVSSYSPALYLINRLDFYSYIVGLHVLLI